jgi:hypothetical protein
MMLVEDWKAVLAKAWSLKFNAAAGILGALEVWVALVQPAGVPNGVFAGFAAGVSMLAFGARLMAQKELSDGAIK